MRIDTISRQAQAPNTQIIAKVSKGHMNGLLLASTQAPSASTITIKRRTGRETYVLANQQSIGVLSRVSDMRRGFSIDGNKAWSVLFNTLKTFTAAGSIWTDALSNTFQDLAGQVHMNLLYIDLGSLFLSGDNELDIIITFDANVPAGNFGVYSASIEKRPDFMLQYDSVLDFDSSHSMVDSIYYVDDSSARALVSVNETNGVITESTVAFQVRDDADVGLFDALGLVAASQVFGESEGVVSQRVTTLYRRPDPLPADVYVKVQGVQAAVSVRYLLVVKLNYDLATLNANTIASAEYLAQRIARLEATNPMVAEALRHSGDIVKSDSLAAAAAALKG